ncbi:nitrophenyl compound nitroreductase subunit ArsF family protein [Bacteroidota bacterium]
MKTLIISMSLLFLVLPGIYTAKNTHEPSKNPKIKVIYFHGNHRCYTCKSIEAHTKKTLQTYFANELEKGIITFESINIDEDENKSIAEEYKVFGSSLFIVKITTNGEEKNNLTNFAFTYGKDEKKFMTEFKKKINDLINQ